MNPQMFRRSASETVGETARPMSVLGDRFPSLTAIGLLALMIGGQELIAAEKSAQASTSQITTNRPAVRRPASTPTPKHDPADQPFRRAPMAESSRSIALALATNLHVAFDTQLLRTHTAWQGSSLNLFGPPYHGGKSPFLCTYDGSPLWAMPPLCPWTAGALTTNDLPQLPPGSKFKGFSTKGSAVTLLYDIGIGVGRTLRIHESARRESVGTGSAVVRRFEIESCNEDIWFLAHAEMGQIQMVASKSAALIQRNGDAILVVALGLPGVSWHSVEKSVSYQVALNAESRGESIVENVRVTGQQARTYLRIPAHAGAIAVEIASVVCRDRSEAMKLASELVKATVKPADMLLPMSKAPNAHPAAPRVFAGEKSPPQRDGGDDYYRIEHFPIPKELGLLVTGMDWLANGNLAICTWPGDICIVEHPQGAVEAAQYRRYASGLNEPLGIKVRGDQMYVVQKSELTRITDTDGDGEADLYETINDSWGYSGNYHAFAFGPVIDRQDNFYAFFCGQRGRWDIPYVGWCVKVQPDGGRLEGFTRGLRAPNGVGTFGPDDDLFVTDNQGNWVGTCKLSHLRPDRFYGYPSGFPAPEAEYAQPKNPEPPAVWFPRKLSPSASGFATISDDRFGPFSGQMLVGDFQNAVVMRVFLEKVNGDWQGAVWPFEKGFLSGVNRLAMGADGKLYVGGLKNVAWAASAPKEYSLDRVSFTGKAPFEIKEARATPSGFELTLTQPVEIGSAVNADNYDVSQFGYLYHQTYGSPEIDHEGKKDSATPIKVVRAAVSADRLRVQLTLQGWKAGYVTMVRAAELKNGEGKPLWHDTFYYTLNQIPRN
jgi:glucose/arabinose dehydrogenase